MMGGVMPSGAALATVYDASLPFLLSGTSITLSLQHLWHTTLLGNAMAPQARHLLPMI
jgi:hypothetical protein